jgi:uncharacterized membrane protein YfcA
VFGLLTVVLLIALVARTVLRWQREMKVQDKLPRSGTMSPHLPLGMILLGVGAGLLGFIFGEPEYPFADFRRQLEDMRIFGIEALQYKWVLAASVCRYSGGRMGHK